jgi:hypothetical protein
MNISYRSPQFTDRNYWSLFNPSIGLAYDLSPNLLIVGDLNIEVVSRTPFYVNTVFVITVFVITVFVIPYDTFKTFT